MTRDRGFVLVNALVLVAALASVAVVLLQIADQKRVTRELSQKAVQTGLYLDAFEEFAISVLVRDAIRGGPDHLKEDWARADISVPLDRGAVSGTLSDLQGRFNINWLSNPGDDLARAAFRELAGQIDISTVLAEEIIGFVSPQGDVTESDYRDRPVPIKPPHGALGMLEELRLVAGMNAATFARISPYLATLPANAPLNVNTTPPEILAGFLPGVDLSTTKSILRDRPQEPFASTADFFEVMAGFVEPDILSEIDDTRFTERSNWFAADIFARLDDLTLGRETVFRMRRGQRRVEVAYRLGRDGQE